MAAQEKITCPLCKDTVDKLVFRFHLESEKSILEKIKSEHADWDEESGICSRCLDYYHTEIVIRNAILPEVGPHFPIRSLSDFAILPTGLRVNAHPRFTGKGVTICFIDSGFYLHPDLTGHKNRILKIIDIANPNNKQSYFSKPHPESWHGTMTSVACAGDGYLSKGLYKGIASDAELVLLKVQDADGRITAQNIIKALEWVNSNHRKYNIRILNISLGDDHVASFRESNIDKMAEKLIAQGISIVAAIGNDESGEIRPPANALNVISVGGINDNNHIDANDVSAYHSTFGKTVDDLMKPELVTQAIWIAAPILPETPEQIEAALLEKWHDLPAENLMEELKRDIHLTKLDAALVYNQNIDQIRQGILQRLTDGKYISPHYMHVDGTSFAAPIVCSVIAQLLEASPQLNPLRIRELLFSTARRSENIAAVRQGYGIIQPRSALLKIIKRENTAIPVSSPYIDQKRKTISFHIHHDCAQEISICGSFNNWAQNVLLLEPGKDGKWAIDIPLVPEGRYAYKFLIDNKVWVEDVNNPYREPDGFHGFNSVLLIKN